MGGKPANQYPEVCPFCEIIYNKKENLLFENNEIVVFHDINLATAKAHILCCPKECI